MKSVTEETPQPTQFEYSLGHPSSITALDIDIIKLTAQFTAANGRDFLAGLAQREQRNPQFDFLKPTHMLFSYFTSLVDSYSKILHPTQPALEKVAKLTDANNCLEEAITRWEWNRQDAEKKRKENTEADADRLAFQAIDWFDFTVVEKIDFAMDELFEIEGMAALGMGNKEEETQKEEPKKSGVEPPRMVAPPPPPAFGIGAISANVSNEQVTHQLTEEDSELNIVSNYQPRLAGTASVTRKNEGGMMTLDPISGKLVAVSELSEHMRIQLLDPKWREEQRRFTEKQKETNYAEGSSIADSLRQFAQKRGDIFGQSVAGTGKQSAAAIAEQEAAEKAKAAVIFKVSFIYRF